MPEEKLNWYFVVYQADGTTFGRTAEKVVHDPEAKLLTLTLGASNDDNHYQNTGVFSWLRNYFDFDETKDKTVLYVDLLVVGHDPQLKHLWKFKDAFAISVDFGMLDYSNSDQTEINIVIKYVESVIHEVENG